MKKGILIAYGEMFLKSENVRKSFQRKLDNNLCFFLGKEKINFKIYSSRERIFIALPAGRQETSQLLKTKKVIKRMFGIAWFSECFYLSDEKELLNFKYKDYIKKGETFAIRMKRDRQIIDKVAKLLNNKVNLDKPKKELFVEKRDKSFFLYFKKNKGLGGLPAEVSGKVLSMISGGIDSVPAAYLSAKRGAETVWIHFHSFPLVSNKSIEKVKELAEVFEKYQKKVKIYFVPFQDIQMEIKAKAPANYRVLLYRRLMLQIAEKIAKKEGCYALVTGESLGQVSSQTLPNMEITEEGVKIPVLRPLIGMDKEEIIELAKKIDTYDISIKPQEDCCTLFVPKHQTAHGNLEITKKLESKLKVRG